MKPYLHVLKASMRKSSPIGEAILKIIYFQQKKFILNLIQFLFKLASRLTSATANIVAIYFFAIIN